MGEAVESLRPWPLKTPCKQCGCEDGHITVRGGQACLYCAMCGTYSGRNVPKAELGEPRRSVSSRKDIKPSVRARIMERDCARCLTCGKPAGVVELHIAHILSVDEGQELGATDDELNDDENLFAQCEECNLGQGKRSVSPRLALRLIRAAMMRAERGTK